MSNNAWLLRVPESLDAGSDWAWRNGADDGAEDSCGTLAGFAAAVAATARQRIVALLPVAQVLAVPVNAPLRQQRQLQAALPFLLEETLATEVERFHVIAGNRIDSQRLQLVAIEREWLASALACMQAAGVDPDIVTADALALSGAGGTLFLDGAHSLLASRDGNALVFDERDADAVLAALPQQDGPIDIRVARAEALAIAGALESAALADERGPAVQIDATPVSLLACVASLPANRIDKLPDLRQGSFAKAGAGGFSPGFDWRPLAWLAASWAVLALGYQVAVGLTHARAAADVKSAQVALYRNLFPGSTNVPSPRQQMEGQIGSGAAGDVAFVALVGRTADALASVGAGGAGYSPRSLAWDSEQRQLRIDIVARSLEDLDRLRAALQQQGLVVDIGAGVSQDGGYKARMNVGEGA